MASLVLSRSPLPQHYIDVLESTAEQFDYEVLISPSRAPTHEVFSRIMAVTTREELDRYTSRAELYLDLTPSTDDRPYFFSQVPFNKPMQIIRLVRDTHPVGVAKGNLIAAATLAIILLVSVVLVVATIVIPLRPAIRHVGNRTALSGTAYFLLLGFGFMSVEIGLLQRMSVFLGHPMYSLSVVLFSLIFMTGIGSFVSDRLPFDRRMFTVWSLLVGGYILALSIGLSTLSLAFNTSELPGRIACSRGASPSSRVSPGGSPRPW